MNAQPMAALRKANSIRAARTLDKEILGGLDIAAGRRVAAGILDNPPDHWLTAPLIDLLDPIRYVGPLTISKWLKQADVRRHSAEFTPIVKLTDRERQALRTQILEWSPPSEAT